MPVVCWFYRSFTNSFTLCLICLACAARIAFCCLLFAFGYSFFIPYLPGVAGGSVVVEQRLSFSAVRCPLSPPAYPH